MLNIKQHTLQSGERILMVSVPNIKFGIYPRVAYSDGINNFFPEGIFLTYDEDYIKLPQGNYQILCLAKDATEEQAAMVIDIKGRGDSYKNYSDKLGNAIRTAKESLTSLLTSLGFKQDDNVLILEKI